MNKTSYVRPMGIIEMFRSVFELYRQHFFQLILVNAIIIIPSLFSNMALFLGLQADSIALQCVLPSIFFIFTFIAIYFGLAATTVAASNAVLGRPVSARGAFQRVFSAQLIWRLFVASLEVGLRIELGMILLIIPGIIASVWYLLFSPILVLEKIIHRPTLLKRSRELTRGHFWRVLFTYGILFYIPNFIVSSIIGYQTVIIGVRMGLSILSSQIVSLFVASFYSLVVAPVGSLLLILLYYDLRARKENYNEELLAQEMGYRPLGEMVTV